MHNEKAIDLCKTTMYNKAVPKDREQVDRPQRAAVDRTIFGRRQCRRQLRRCAVQLALYRKVEESMEWKMSRKLIKILAESACVMTMTSESDSRYTLIGRL